MQDAVKPGDFVIVQRQQYTKLQRIKPKATIALGKDVVELDNAIGHRFSQTFRMTLKPGTKRVYTLEQVTEKTPSSLTIGQSGADNRDIVDDGLSQALTKEQIEELRDRALSSKDIVEKLVENSKTFSSKTEYSQEKYLKKKEKKYFEYILIRKPSIRLLAQMYFRQDPSKTQGMRTDDLSQVLTYGNVQAEGDYLLYDSGSSGLVTAAILHAIGANTTGRLIHAHPGNECQKNAVLAMQFPKEQLDRCINVNLYSVLRCYYQQKDSYNTSEEDVQEKKEETVVKLAEEKEKNDDEKTEETSPDVIKETNESNPRKRKLRDASNGPKPKKPCWQIENEKACRILENKVHSLIIMAKEHPVNIVKELVQFLGAGRTLVVFNLIKEPLQELYFYLKGRTDFININLSSNFMRTYQVLPERTHPEVTMNSGGYVLSGYKLKG